MMLMGLIMQFWLGFEETVQALPCQQKLRISYQAAKRADAADGHAGKLLDSELLPSETSTGLEGLVPGNKQGASTVLRPAIPIPPRGWARPRATAERKNRLHQRRNAETQR